MILYKLYKILLSIINFTLKYINLLLKNHIFYLKKINKNVKLVSRYIAILVFKVSSKYRDTRYL